MFKKLFYKKAKKLSIESVSLTATDSIPMQHFENGVLLTGASGSGKSTLSNKLLSQLVGQKKMFFVASCDSDSIKNKLLLDHPDLQITTVSEINVSFRFPELESLTKSSYDYLDICLTALEFEQEEKSAVFREIDDTIYYESVLTFESFEKICRRQKNFSTLAFEDLFGNSFTAVRPFNWLSQSPPNLLLAVDPFSTSLDKRVVVALARLIRALSTEKGESRVFLFDDLNISPQLSERTIKQEYYAAGHILIISDQNAPPSFLRWFDILFLFKTHSAAIESFEFLTHPQKDMLKSFKVGQCMYVKSLQAKALTV